jgi:protein involved in polysaccharide export with SLBB domain
VSRKSSKKNVLIISFVLALSLISLIAQAVSGGITRPEPVFAGQDVNNADSQTDAKLKPLEESPPAVIPEPKVDYKAVLDENTRIKATEKYRNFTAREYILGPNDVININVTTASELNQGGLRVNPEGKINIKYMNNLYVAGLTLKELSGIIADTYKEYVINPEVIINLEQSRPFIVYVSGAVKNPGSYELNTVPNTSPYVTKPEAYIERKTPLLSNIVLAAGGISYDADIERIKITNQFDGSTYEVNLYGMISDSDDIAQDLFLMGGDKVYVPRLPSPGAIDEDRYRLLAKSTLFQKQVPVRVIGYVNHPGLVQLESADSSNINSAIAAAGGYITNYGSYPKKVYLSRLDNNNKLKTRAVNPLSEDVVVMPNDIVYVPEKTIPLIGKFFDYASRLMGPFGTYSNTYQSWDNMLK